MKKLISIILISIILFSSLGLSTFSATTSDEFLTDNVSTEYVSSTEEVSEEKIVCNATIEDDFEDDSVIVVFKNSKSKKLENHTLKSFSNISAKSITDLTSRTKGKIEKQRNKSVKAKNTADINAIATSDELHVDENKFHQIIKIDLGVKSKENVLACVKELEKLDDVLMACPNYYFKPTSEITPDDPYFPEDGSDDGQWGSRLIGLPKAWNETTGSSTVKVGVLDSGIDKTHPDLKNRYNATLSKDFTGGNSPGTDTYGHGTQVAGIIGAEANNGEGIAGVCWDVSLVSLKVATYNEDSEFTADLELVTKAIDYANDNNISILNFSYCGENECDEDLVPFWENYSGLLVCSTTNERENVTDIEIAYYDYNPKNTIVVTATNINDELLEFYNSNGDLKGASYSATKVHLAAPGDDIWTTANNTSTGYIKTYGTSMATPYVTGVAALLKSKYTKMDTAAIKANILNNVDIIPALNGKVSTGGRLNADEALSNPEKFTVKYLANGGGGSVMSNSTIIRGCATALKANTYTRNGYTFECWYAKRTDTGLWYYTNGTKSNWYAEGQQPSGYYKYPYKDKQVVSRTAANGKTVEMYAQWNIINYSLSFGSNNATGGSMPTFYLDFNDSMTLPANTFTRTGCTFDHWYAKNQDGNFYYVNGNEGGWYAANAVPTGYTRMDISNKHTISYSTFNDISDGDSITLYAYWKPNSGLLGDANMSGSITAADATYIQKYASNQLETIPDTDDWMLLADVNFDGKVTVSDATLIQRYVAKTIDEFGI